MKNRIVVIGFLCALFGLLSCEDDSLKVQLNENVGANELDELSSSNYILTLDEAATSFETFNWTAPDFGFPAASNYVVQIDKAGNNFGSALSLITTTTISGSITIGELNKKMLDLGFSPDEEGAVEVRVRSAINDNVDPVYSNTIQFTVTPYATTFPPIYMIGDATGGWDLANAVEMESLGNSRYETIATFTKNGIFRFFKTPSWSATQYNWAAFDGGSVDAKLQNKGDGDGNFEFVGDTGSYKITVDIPNKSIVLVLQ